MAKPNDYPGSEIIGSLCARPGGNVNFWTSLCDQVTEPCDLNGQLKVEVKYKVTLSDSFHVKEEKAMMLVIEETLCYELKTLGSKHNIFLPSILQFAWHKVLNVYGNGNQTVIATAKMRKDTRSPLQSPHHALPVIVDHQEQQSQCCIKSISSIEAKIIHMLNNGDYVDLCQSKRGLFDSLFVVADNDISGQELHFR